MHDFSAEWIYLSMQITCDVCFLVYQKKKSNQAQWHFCKFYLHKVMLMEVIRLLGADWLLPPLSEEH